MRLKIEHRDDAPALDRLRILRRGSGSLEAAIFGRRRIAVIQAVLLCGSREAHREVELSPRRPSAGLAHACYGAVVANPQARPEHFAGIVIDRRTKIEQNMRRLARGVGVSMNTDTSTGSQLGMNAVVEQINRIVAGLACSCL